MLRPKYAQLITMHSQDFQRKVYQSKGWLSHVVWFGTLKGMGLWTCGQDGYRAQSTRQKMPNAKCFVMIVLLINEHLIFT